MATKTVKFILVCSPSKAEVQDHSNKNYQMALIAIWAPRNLQYFSDKIQYQKIQ